MSGYHDGWDAGYAAAQADLADARQAASAEREKADKAQLLTELLNAGPPSVQDQLVAFVERRKQVGLETYGTLLRPHNGRDALMDALEEAVDLSLYLAQAIIERDGALPRNG